MRLVSDALGRHAVALASVHELAARAGAQRVVLLVDEGEDATATMIEWAGERTLELTEAGVTEPVSSRRRSRRWRRRCCPTSRRCRPRR